MTGTQIILDRTDAEQGEAASARQKPSLRDYFFKVRRDTGLDRYDLIVLAIYTVILAFAIHHHLAWADEAQGWLIARDSSLHDLLFRRLHYEGAPALWPLILWTAIRLHLPYTSVNWLSGMLALPGIYLLLNYSPFPRIFRWLLPFTFFLQYEYAVIARPYVFYPLLVFTLCILYTSEHRRPILFAVVAGLLANIGMHGAIFACLFLGDYLWKSGRSGKTTPRERHIAAPILVFALFLFAAALVAFPAPDGSFAIKQTTSKGWLHTALAKLLPEEQRPAGSPPLDPALVNPYTHRSEDSPRPTAGSPLADVLFGLITKVILALNAAAYSVSESNVLAAAFLIIWARWLWSRHATRFAVGFFLGTFLCIQIWVFGHHTGLFVLAILATAWISLKSESMTRGQAWITPAFGAIALTIALLQVGWSGYALWAETARPYDAGLQTEQFLKQNYAGKKIAGFTFETVSTQPYSDANLYINWPHSYFSWGKNVVITQRRTETLEMKPDVVVYGDYIVGKQDIANQFFPISPAGVHPYIQMLDFWERHGYRQTHSFCGYRTMRFGVSSTVCEIILERNR